MRRNDNYHNYINHYNNQIHLTYIQIKRLKEIRSQLVNQLIEFDKETNKNYRNISVEAHHRRCGQRNRILLRISNINRYIRSEISHRLLFKEDLSQFPLG